MYMMFLTILHHYLLWHYSQAYLQFFNVWKNLLWFIVHFFSIPQLMRSWLAPWKRITEERTKAWDLEDLFGSIVINIISRIIGAIMRTAVIIIGTISLVCTFACGLLVYLIWTIAPALIVFMIILGVAYIV